MTDKVPLFSAVIAAYNIEPYIVRCIESILKVAREDLELIIVVGKQTDRTNEICDSYMNEQRVRVIRQDGRGLSNARNCGLNIVHGKYVFFVDGDDFVRTERLQDFLQNVFELSNKVDFDVIVNDFYYADEQGNVLLESRQIENRNGLFIDYQYAVKLAKQKGTFWNTWRYLFSSAYLKNNHMQFREDSACEDLDFAVRVFMDTKKIWFCHLPYYYYCPVRSGSLVNTTTVKMVDDSLEIQQELRTLLKKEGSVLTSAILHKLDELIILSLPDIWNISRSEQKRCVYAYQHMIQREHFSSDFLYEMILSICKTRCIYVVSYFLYLLKKIRRKIRYG